MDVPYRCPKCGDSKTFSVLSELKQHLSQAHSYVPTPRKRTQAFNGDKSSNWGRISPLLQSFYDEGQRLEKQLQDARDSETNNKLKRYGNKENGDILIANLAKPSGAAVHHEHLKNSLNFMTWDLNVLSHQVQMNKERSKSDSVARGAEVLKTIEKAAENRCAEQKSIIDKLSASLKVKEGDLKKSKNELERLRQEQQQLMESAEILSQKNNEESRRLGEELESKEVQLSRVHTQLAQLRQNSLEDWTISEKTLKDEKDTKNMLMEKKMLKTKEMNRANVRTVVMGGNTERNQRRGYRVPRNEDLDEADHEVEALDLLSQELQKMQQDAFHKMQEKDKQLMKARKRSEKLEKDRQILLHEMEELLSKANDDNEQMKTELQCKDEELMKFNTDLENAKKEQSKLVGETFELYRQADKNIAKLKELLTLKDFQLKAANEKLFQFQAANQHLLSESENVVQHADEKGDILEAMLKTMEKRLHSVEKELKDIKLEKEKLVAEAVTLKEEVIERSRSAEELKQELQKKEEELEKTNNDLLTLQTFLQTTAAKESAARQELETFIMELINRADKAEKEVRTLKRQLREASISRESDTSQSKSSTHIPEALQHTLREPILQTSGLSVSIGPDNQKNMEEFPVSQAVAASAVQMDTSGQNGSAECKIKSESIGQGHASGSHLDQPVSSMVSFKGSDQQDVTRQDPSGETCHPKREITDTGQKTRDVNVSIVNPPSNKPSVAVGTELPLVTETAVQTDSTSDTIYLLSDTEHPQEAHEVKSQISVNDDSKIQNPKAKSICEKCGKYNKANQKDISRSNPLTSDSEYFQLSAPTVDQNNSDRAEDISVPSPVYTSTPIKLPETSNRCRFCQKTMKTTDMQSEREGAKPKRNLTYSGLTRNVFMNTRGKEDDGLNKLEEGPKDYQNSFERHPSRTLEYDYSGSSAPSKMNVMHPLALSRKSGVRDTKTSFSSRYQQNVSGLEETGLRQHLNDSQNSFGRSKAEGSKIDSLSERIDKLESIVTSARNDKLAAILSDEKSDTERQTTKQDIKRLRESIKTRLRRDERKGSRFTEHHEGDRPSPEASEGKPPKKQLEDMFKREDLVQSGSSSDSFIGLPRSAEPGIVIRNQFYDKSDRGETVHSASFPGQYFNPVHHVSWRPRWQGEAQQRMQDLRVPYMVPYGPVLGSPLSPLGMSAHENRDYVYSDQFHEIPSYPPQFQHGVRERGAHHPQQPHQKFDEFDDGILHSEQRTYEILKKSQGNQGEEVNFESNSLELGVDENGILWDDDLVESVDDIDSFEVSPSGSETAGDVDSSLVYSGSGFDVAGARHAQILDEIAETDESSYRGLPQAKALDGSRHNKNTLSEIRPGSGGSKATHLKPSAGLQRDKGGMVSDIQSVRDKMMKFLDEDDLKKDQAKLGKQAIRELPMKGKDCLLNNSLSSKPESKGQARTVSESDMIHNKFDVKTEVSSEDDYSSSSYAPFKLKAGSRSKLKRTDTFDQNSEENTQNSQDDFTSMLPSKLASSREGPAWNPPMKQGLDENIVREEIIQPKKKIREKISLDEMSRKLDLMSSSTESLDLAPRRKPKFVKKPSQKNKVSESSRVVVEHSQVPDITENFLVMAEPFQVLDIRNRPQTQQSDVQQEKVNLEVKQTKPEGASKEMDKCDELLNLAETNPQGQVKDTEGVASPPQDASKQNTEQQPPAKPPRTFVSSPEDKDDLSKFSSVPLKQAQPLVPRFADEATTDEDLDDGSVDGILKNGEGSHDFDREDSTDFDFESDLEKLSTPWKLSRFGGKNKPKKKSVLGHKRAAIRAGAPSRRLSVPKVNMDESSDGGTDTGRVGDHHNEASRRRRVALFCVFKYLDTNTLTRISLVCREWKHVSRHPNLWKKVQLKNERISSTEHDEHGLQGRQRRTGESLDEYQQNTRASLEAGLEGVLKNCQDTLKSLRIIACQNIVTNKCLWLASCYCRLLEKLEYISSSDPVSPEVLWAIGGGCPGVTSLLVPPLYPCKKPKSFNSKCLQLIGQFYPDLVELGIGGVEISIKGLLPLGCQRLQYLVIDHVPELTNDDVTALCRAGLRQLSVLELNSTRIKPEGVQTLYKSCRHLKSLQILLSFTDFFDNPSKKKHREEYKKKIKQLQGLLDKPGLGNILKIQAGPVE